MMHSSPLLTRLRTLLFSLALINSVALHSMEPEITWNTLPVDVKMKIFACADLQTKEKVYLQCHEMFPAITDDIFNHSPLILTRKAFQNRMINAARSNNRESFLKVLNSAIECGNSDILRFMINLFPEGSEKHSQFQLFCSTGDDCLLDQLATDVLEVYRDSKTFIDQKYCKLFESMKCKRDDVIRFRVKEINDMTLELKPMIDISALHSFTSCFLESDIDERLLHLRRAIMIRLPNCCLELLLLQNPEWLSIKGCKNGITPLAMAIKSDNLDLFKSLLADRRTNVCDDGTLLKLAIGNRRVEMFELLIDYYVAHHLEGKYLKGKNASYDKTLWFYIINKNIPECLISLLKSINFEVPHKEKPLSVAAAEKKLECVAELLKYPQIDVHATDDFGRTALYYASCYKYFFYMPIVDLLLKHGANVNELMDSDNKTILWCATNKNFSSGAIKAIFEYKPDMEIKSGPDSTTPLHEAILGASEHKASLDNVSVLLEQGANPNTPSGKDNMTPLLYVAQWSPHEMKGATIIKKLLESGARVDVTDGNGFTPLMHAASKGNAFAVNLLIKHGADIDYQVNGETALSYARAHGHKYVVDLLEKAQKAKDKK